MSNEIETEALIGRVVDCEATAADCTRFELMADADAAMWDALARRQLEQAMLAAHVAERLAPADTVEAPHRRRGVRFRDVLGLSGWAAVMALLAWWAVAGGIGQRASTRVETVASPPAGDLAPAEHLRRYLEADHVLGELDLVLLDVEPLADGRTRLRFIRRIEEHAEIDFPVEAIVEDGKLLRDPSAAHK